MCRVWEKAGKPLPATHHQPAGQQTSARKVWLPKLVQHVKPTSSGVMPLRVGPKRLAEQDG